MIFRFSAVITGARIIPRPFLFVAPLSRLPRLMGEWAVCEGPDS